jgi:TIR domain
VTRLEEHGWDVWWDREIPPGQTWTDVLERALSETRVVVVVWTKASIKSDWVEIEASEGRQRSGLFPVALDEVVPPLQFRLIQAADLTRWDGSSKHAQFQILARQIEGALRGGEVTKAEESTAAARVRPTRRLETLAPALPSVLDYGAAAGGATWHGEPYTVAVAQGS